MERVGEIISIAGPLITAKGIPGVKMYEVCKVGEKELIGEVNRVEGDVCYIQVYEETAGIKPGEKVIGTGEALSVELGPGLIGQIFDGIQRPLPLIKTIAGDFITRGITVPALDRNKKWRFTPSVKKGEKVTGGDQLGTVPETTLVKHIIMVPPNIEGEIVEVAPEGEYKIEDTIAKIKTKEGEIISLTMIQKWPVRKPRPYKTKLPAEVPLITGQRIIDTFFPVAKGGTSGIPGGFGTGKCVLPNTEVLLEDGRIIPIEQLFKEIKGAEPEENKREELIKINKNLRIYSFNGKEIKGERASHIYRGYSDKIIRIQTASGRTLEITPQHKLITFNPTGYFEEKPAKDFKIGDYIVIPRKIPFESKPQKLIDVILTIPEARIRDKKVNLEAVKILKEASKKVGGYRKLANILGLKPTTLTDYITGRNKIQLSTIAKLCELTNRTLTTPLYIGLTRSKKIIKIPETIDEKFAELLGLILSSGVITSRAIKFFNIDKELLNKVKELFKEVFDIKAKSAYDRNVKCVEVYSTLIAELLSKIGVTKNKKSRNANIPQVILKSPEEVIGAFIKGYYLGGGLFSKETIEFSSASPSLIHGLAYLLSRLGILYSIYESQGRTRLTISGIGELLNFIKHIKYERDLVNTKIRKILEYINSKQAEKVTRDVIPLDTNIIRAMLDIISKRRIEERNISIGGGLYSKEKLRNIMAQRTYDVLSEECAEFSELLRNIIEPFTYVALDKVKKTECIKGRFTVYDLTIPHTHNFIGGRVPTIFHNTVTLHQVASWADAHIIIYVGCGERGNEMTEVLEKFPTYKDPRTGEPLMNRTVLVANTSNMPVAAREASIYTAITMAEYFRDMGYDVALQADSTSRWAEALRELSGRLEEMPGEEGYPAYLSSRLAEFYERAGRVTTIGSKPRIGSATITGAVSPPGGDFSEPVTQATLRIIKTFWALDSNLSRRRHFPAINWLNSYSLYLETLQKYYDENINPEWNMLRDKAMALLEEEEKLTEIVQLIGPDALPESERAVLEAARMIREDYLQQSALHPIDTYSPLYKMYRMLKATITFYEKMREAVAKGITIREILDLPVVEKIARMKIIPYDDKAKMNAEFDQIEKEINEQFLHLELQIKR